MPIFFKYDNASNLNITYELGVGIKTVLTTFIREEVLNYEDVYLDSTIIFTVQANISLNDSLLECNNGKLSNDTSSLLVNTSGTPHE